MNEDAAVDRDVGGEQSLARDNGDAWSAIGAASREKANAYLDEQRELALEQKKLVHLQAKELLEALRLRYRSLRMCHAASKQFAIASHFDLNTADTVELVRMRAIHG